MITATKAVGHFRETVATFNRSSLMLLSSAAVCFITGAYSKKDKRDYSETMAELKEVVTEEGLKMAQMYKYIGLARQLVVFLVKQNPLLEGPIHDVLDAKTPKAASQVLVTFLEDEKVQSLDGVGAFLGGAYQRSANEGERAPRTTTATNGTDGQSDEGTSRRKQTDHVPVTTTPEEVTSAIEASPVVAHTVADTLSDTDTFEKVVAEIDSPATISAMIAVLERRLEALVSKGKGRGRGRTATKAVNGRRRGASIAERMAA